MPQSYLKYQLSNGYIHNWLVAGPQSLPVLESIDYSNEDLCKSLNEHFYTQEVGLTYPPVDLGLLFEDDPSLSWRYYRCREDHFVDLSTFSDSLSYLRSFAYAQVDSPASRGVTLVMTSNWPVDVWVNGQHILLGKHFNFANKQNILIPVNLQAGHNEILMRLDVVARRDTSCVMALRVIDLPEDDISVLLPSELDTELMEKRMILEKVVEKAYLDRYVYGYLGGDQYNKNEPVTMRFAPDLDLPGEITYRLQSLKGDIFIDGTKSCSRDSIRELARTFPLRNGPHHLALLPPAKEYYVKRIRFERKELFHVIRTPYSRQMYGTIEDRKKEALEDASQRRNESIYCEVAKVALKRGEKIDRKIIQQAVERIAQRKEGSVRDLLGLLGLLARFWRSRDYLKDLVPAVEASILGFRYWDDLPGEDIMDFTTESLQILFHTCEILAGQLMPSRNFGMSGKTGEWHREHGETHALAWMRRRGMYGFGDWDSSTGFEEILAALAHLIDLARSDSVVELASALMDKIFFSIALNSLQGMYGSTRGRVNLDSAVSARLEATSGISRLMWGMGNFNENVMGTVSLACCKNYELAEVIQKIALDVVGAVWSRECHTVDIDNEGTTPRLVNKVTYKTRDFLLSSAQDYRPGEAGAREHIWQATLGPDAVAFVNHPACLNVSDLYAPNLWVGNGCLPRVAQWGDVLVAIYQLPETDWLGFTHAYFPTAVFDEYRLQGNWAFARAGEGYLALGAANGLVLITQGQTAYRELRSYGNDNTWICHMGQVILDGDFEKFIEKILAMEVQHKPLSVSMRTLRGDTLTFGWSDPFIVNNQEQALSGFKHYESPYCVADLPAEQMDIIFQDEGIRLNFS